MKAFIASCFYKALEYLGKLAAKLGLKGPGG